MSEAPNTADVAFSFRAADEPIAREIEAALEGAVSCFIFAERQEELAGQDGLEKLTRVFASDSRVVVVLFRAGWGATPWTRAEETAIKNRLLEQGWSFLLFVNLDGSPPPVWLPKTHIWWDFQKYGARGAAAVVLSKFREAGGDARVETAIQKAERLGRAARDEETKQQFLRSVVGVNAATNEVAKLFDLLSGKVRAIAGAAPSKEIQFHKASGQDLTVLRCPTWSVLLFWKRRWSNSLDGSALTVREIKGRFVLGYTDREPDQRSLTVYEFTIDAERQGGWREKGERIRILSSEELSEHLLSLVMEHLDDPDTGPSPLVDW